MRKQWSHIFKVLKGKKKTTVNLEYIPIKEKLDNLDLKILNFLSLKDSVKRIVKQGRLDL